MLINSKALYHQTVLGIFHHHLSRPPFENCTRAPTNDELPIHLVLLGLGFLMKEGVTTP